ncbi:unnamed protein product [Cylicocyclus nassatus]|uniref:Chromatin modification-related protein MEAF6 n=1 Tax=Cylicocyclus nassatus TaxID=53992 RepID=A0AA36DMQ8_CYLNA|nr:unnamed protein product [Cylicocyclus nassatus]
MAGSNQSEGDEKLNELLKQREDVENVLQLLEDQLYKFEGELLSTSFYGSVLSGWDRSAMSVTPSKATPEMLNRKIKDDERLMSRSSIPFTRRQRREAADQENRNRGRLSRENNMSSDSTGDTKRKRTSSPVALSTETRHRLSDEKK